MSRQGKLIFFCGKMAAGKSTLSTALAEQLIEAAGVEHELHFIDAPDAVCKRQLRERSAGLPAGTPWTTEAEFDAITAYFQPPTADERFNVIRHERG